MNRRLWMVLRVGKRREDRDTGEGKRDTAGCALRRKRTNSKETTSKERNLRPRNPKYREIACPNGANSASRRPDTATRNQSISHDCLRLQSLVGRRAVMYHQITAITALFHGSLLVELSDAVGEPQIIARLTGQWRLGRR